MRPLRMTLLTPVPQMLSRRIVRATPFGLRAARALPVTQRRTFLPEEMAGKKVTEQHYPSSDYPSLTAAEDPDMVRGLGAGRRPDGRAPG